MYYNMMCQRRVTHYTPSSLREFKFIFCLFFCFVNFADGASLSQVAFLLSEGSTLCCVNHPNIMSPLAACTDLPGPPQIAYSYSGIGNLKM